MGKIICLMGKSSSGKDTIYKNLMEDKSLGLRKLTPYTGRGAGRCGIPFYR